MTPATTLRVIRDEEAVGSDPATPTSRSEALSERSGRASDAFPARNYGNHAGGFHRPAAVSTFPPFSNSSMDASRRRALAGFRNKYAVSFRDS
jgi:hypothetical protein